MAGWESLGNALAGGIDRQGAFEQGRYRSAQTESALANARQSQAAAMKAEREQELRDKIAASGPQALLGDDLMGSLIAGGMGSDYSAAMSGRNARQEFGMREEMAAPAVTDARATNLRRAVGDAPFNPLDAVGTEGAFIDTRAPELGVQGLAEELGLDFGDLTSAGKNYLLTLPAAEREAVLQRGLPADQFEPFVRADQIVTAGGVPVNTGFGGRGAPTPVVSTETVAGNVAAITDAKATAATQSKLRNALPSTMESIDTMRNGIDNLLAAPGFDTIYGLSADLDPRNYIKGTDAGNALAARDSIDAQAFTVAVQKMRGLGSLSNAEGLKVQQAFTKAMDPRLDEDAARVAWADVQMRLANLERVAEQEAGVLPQDFQKETATGGGDDIDALINQYADK